MDDFLLGILAASALGCGRRKPKVHARTRTDVVVDWIAILGIATVIGAMLYGTKNKTAQGNPELAVKPSPHIVREEPEASVGLKPVSGMTQEQLDAEIARVEQALSRLQQTAGPGNRADTTDASQ